MRSAGVVAAFVLCLPLRALTPSIAAARLDDEDKITSRSCRLAKGRVGRVMVREKPEGCGSGGCGQRTTTTVHDSNDQRLLTLTHDEGDFDPDPFDVVVRCRRGVVEVRAAGITPELMFPLRFDTASGRLRLAAPAPEADGWQRPPLVGDPAARREQLAQLLDNLLAGGEGDQTGSGLPPWVYNQVDGIDRNLRDGIWLLVARDKIEAGEWEQAQKVLDDLPNKSVKGGPPPVEVARRMKEVDKLLADARARTMPVKVIERRRIGTTLAPQRLPIDPGEPAGMFWRNDELCVIQEEQPPRNMRCYSPSAKRWGAAVPIERPGSDGRGFKVVRVSGRDVEQCAGAYDVSMVLPKSVPDDRANACADDGLELNSIVAAVEGGKWLLHGARVATGVEPHVKLDAKQATELLRRSAGSLLVGGGCCAFTRTGALEQLSGPSEKTWDVRGATPPGEKWVEGPPLASPDQRWAVAQSAKPGRVTLWLYRFDPRL
jgi:hypothetical protein